MKLPKYFPLDKIPRKLKKAMKNMDSSRKTEYYFMDRTHFEFEYFVPKQNYPYTKWIRRARKILIYAYGRDKHCFDMAIIRPDAVKQYPM